MKVAARDVMRAGVSLHVRDRGSTLVHKLSGRFRALPVVNDNREVVGIVTAASVRRALRDEETIFRRTAGSLMTCGHLDHHSCGTPLRVTLDTPMEHVIETMLRERAFTMPVVQDRVLVGVINRMDLMLR